MIDAPVSNNNNIRKKEYKKLEEYLGVKEELERMWKAKTKMISIVALGMLLGLGELLVRIVPVGPRNNIRAFCPEEHSTRNN